MGREAGKEGTGACAGEVAPGEGLRRLDGAETEARHEKGVSGYAQDGTKTVFGELLPVVDDGLEQAAPGVAVWAKRPFGIAQVALEDDGGAIVERMRQRCLAVDPLQSVTRQGKRGEEGRPNGHGVHGRAEIMEESG
jgi:hypothetical protein